MLRLFNFFYLFLLIQIYNIVQIIAHAQLFHVGKLTQAVTAFDAFNEVVAFAVMKAVHHIHRCLVDGYNIFGSQDADVRSGYR